MATRIAETAPSPSLGSASLFRRSAEEPLVETSRRPAAPRDWPLDSIYARTRSLGEDLGLLVRIIRVVVRGTGM